jgi:hypothetical protein
MPNQPMAGAAPAAQTGGLIMFKAIVVASALLLTPVAAFAGPAVSPADEKAIDARADSLFKEMNTGHVDTALANAFLPRMSTDNKSALQGLSTQIQAGVNFAGLPLKSEMISENVLASVLVARTYVAYSKDIPVRVKLTFFKTPDGWFVQSLYFDSFQAQDY